MKDFVLRSRTLPEWLIIGFAIALPTSISLMETFAGLITALMLIREFSGQRLKPIPHNPFLLPVLAFVGICVLGIVLSDVPERHKIYDIGRMRFFLYLWSFYVCLQRHVQTQRWFWTLAIVSAIVAVYAGLQHFIPMDLVRSGTKKVILYSIPEEKLGPLSIGTFNHHLTYANVFLLYACIFGAVGFLKKDWRLSTLSLLIFITCIWSQSRVAWFTIPIVALLIGSFKSKKAVAAILALLILVLAGSYSFDAGFKERFDRTFLKKDDFYNLGPRARIWAAHWEMFKDQPLLGVGFNNGERLSPQYLERLYPGVKDHFYGHAHSMPLQILANTGLLGLLTFLSIWFVAFRACFREVNDRSSNHWALYVGLLVAQIGFWIQGLTQWNFGDAEVTHNIIFFWAVIFAYARPITAAQFSFNTRLPQLA